MQTHDHAKSQDRTAAILGGTPHEPVTIHGHWVAAYYAGDWSAEQITRGEAGKPVDVREGENILVNAGIQLLLDLLIGAGGTVYSNANAHIGIGDSTAAVAVGQTDLQASTNKLRKAMDATFPSRSGQTLTFRATYGTSEANFSIQEAGLFNNSSAGTMLNRLLANLGTKTSATTLQVTLTITVS